MTLTTSLVPYPVPNYYDGPRAWVGCLHCYNNGDLVGEWFDATEAADVTLTVLHLEHPQQEGCEELWVFDVDGIPVSEEMSPLEAANWGNLLNSVDELLQPAFYAWIGAGAASYDEGGLPDPKAFEEAFVGTFSGFREYSDHLADETLLYDSNDDVRRYFDYEAFARDLKMDYTVEELPDGDVALFRM
ncbi:antirestriction protein ArdA [Dermabacter vaginalis]|uniref:antirestriction protein ArdA n=1 Tax=Dermabacter vaginalis TaxID=1630135 RepID=UPI0021A55DBD|nr:antirestriction protein ArdA [Dermabacter vaginalis]MCT2149574.1 antirestriction protein ArdA [Dermabacter vaginalis]